MLQTIGFPAGGRQIDAKANFFRYERGSASGGDESIRVRADGNDLGEYLPGDAIRLPMHAERWNISPVDPVCTGVVRLGLGEVSSSRAQLIGNTTIVDAIGAGVQTVGAVLTAVQTAMTAVTIVAPAANVNGMTLRQLSIEAQAGAGGAVETRLVLAPVPPVGYTGNLFPMLPLVSTGSYEAAGLPDICKSFPAGWGIFLYYSVTVAPALAHSYSLSYELL